MITAGMALALVVGSAAAYADPFGIEDESSVPVATATAGSVTLSTGDVVTVGQGGGFSVKTAAGREGIGYLSPRASDGSGDVVVIPTDKISDLIAGNDDPRRYNVSALLRSGQTEAAEAGLSALNDKEYGQFAPVDNAETADDAQRLDVAFTGHNGKAAAEVAAMYIDTRTGSTGELTVSDDGTATAELPPGDYDIVSVALGSDDVNVSAITPVAVDDEAVKATVDGTKASPVEAKVEAVETERRNVNVEIAVTAAGTTVGFPFQPEDDIEQFVIPVDAGQADRRFAYKTTLTPKGSTDAVYNLAFEETAGIPTDVEYSVAADELAALDTNYHSLTGEQSGYASGCAVFDWGSDFVNCHMLPMDIPAQVTQYYTTGTELWENHLQLFGEDSEDIITVVQDLGSLDPGPATNNVGASPLGPHGGRIMRADDTISVHVSHIQTPAADQLVDTDSVSGSLTLSLDGEEIDKIAEPSGDLTVPEGGSGRYTVTLDATVDSTITPLGASGTAEWEFESEPTDELTPVDVSTVVFDAADVVNGSAPVDQAQTFSLDYVAQEGAADATAEEMTFEVSYDDGASWEKVDIIVNGNQATGTLEHPDDAEFVSYRTSANDDSGNKFTATSIRSYALN